MAADVALALTAVAAQVVGTYLVARHSTGVWPLAWPGYWLLAVSGASLVARRRSPSAVLVVTAVSAFVYDALGYPGAFYLVPILLALYTAVATGRRVQAIVAAASILVTFLGADALFDTGHEARTEGALWFAGFLLLSLVVGEMSRGRRAYLAEVEQRAIEAERTREEEARRRAGEERLRIARELHDALGHSISLINVQAGVAAHLLDQQPEQVRSALVTIKQASKEALRELRGTLGVLRQVEENEEAPRAPAPSLVRLDELVAGASAGGLGVQVKVTGEPRRLPARVDLAAYRIVQESLTNVARHAGPATATVRLSYGAHDLVVQVDDDGRGPLDDGEGSLDGGSGLLGMRERAVATGGALETGPRPKGGFRVRARLPLDGGA
ncbi:MAG: sensor histidine kinase [Egibacteraceae bacterium]